MSEASGLIGSSRKALDEGGQMFDHLVIVGGIVTGNT